MPITSSRKTDLSNRARSFLLLLVIVFCLNLASCSSERKRAAAASESELITAVSTLDINSATVAELEQLPNIGPKLANNIVEHRDKFGKFRRKQNLMLVDGMSAQRFREISHLLRAE